MTRICEFEGCDRAHYGRGYCKGHHGQWLENREMAPLVGKALTVTQRFWAKVDKTDACWRWNGTTDAKGYGNFRLAGRMQKAHRTSYEMHHGPIPAGMEVDHACHDRACVNPSHLNVVSRKQNTENRSGARTGSASGIRGVYPYRDGIRWVAQVGHLGKIHHLGLFDTASEAESAAIAKRKELHTNNLLDRKSA